MPPWRSSALTAPHKDQPFNFLDLPAELILLTLEHYFQPHSLFLYPKPGEDWRVGYKLRCEPQTSIKYEFGFPCHDVASPYCENTKPGLRFPVELWLVSRQFAEYSEIAFRNAFSGHLWWEINEDDVPVHGVHILDGDTASYVNQDMPSQYRRNVAKVTTRFYYTSLYDPFYDDVISRYSGLRELEILIRADDTCLDFYSGYHHTDYEDGLDGFALEVVGFSAGERLPSKTTGFMQNLGMAGGIKIRWYIEDDLWINEDCPCLEVDCMVKEDQTVYAKAVVEYVRGKWRVVRRTMTNRDRMNRRLPPRITEVDVSKELPDEPPKAKGL